jgi:hypothetical protein
MDLKIKLLELFEGSYYLIVIAQGIIDSEALKRVFTDVQEITRPLLHCKVFIDFEEASLQVRATALHAIANQLELHSRTSATKMAVVPRSPTVAGDCSCCVIRSVAAASEWPCLITPRVPPLGSAKRCSARTAFRQVISSKISHPMIIAGLCQLIGFLCAGLEFPGG